MVCELFADGAAQIRSPIRTYVYLVREPFASGLQTIRRAYVYEALGLPSKTRFVHTSTVQGNHI